MSRKVSPQPDGDASGDATTSKSSEAGCKDAKRWENFRIIDPGSADTQPMLRIWGKRKKVSTSSLFVFTVHNPIRQKVLLLVEGVWFDRIILFLILLNSVLLTCYQWGKPDTEGYNYVFTQIVDPILTVCFTIELVLKVVAWGFFVEKNSYLRDPWNWLDFVVVVSALAQYALPNMIGLGFLRVFRVLRPLRSLNKVPQMKLLVNTVLTSIPRLGNVSVMAVFLFVIFAIIGITLMDGIFYHRCRAELAPTLDTSGPITCWNWPYDEDDQDRLCGGHYTCSRGKSYCKGHEKDPNEDFRPVFLHGGVSGMQDYPWCEGSEPKKLFPETDFIHFDHSPGALLIVFQSMTLEGWTDIMYMCQDAYSLWFSTIFFFMLVFVTSFFLLNIALAVVDEAREDFATDEPEDKEEVGSEHEGRSVSNLEESLWLENPVVQVLNLLATSEVFLNSIMFVIVCNVVTMMISEQYPRPEAALKEVLELLENIFLGIFVFEMLVMLGGIGPKRYVLNPTTAFDGMIVIAACASKATGGTGPFTALRVLRLLRILNKLAVVWPSFRVLMKAIVVTGKSLMYWLVLFVLMLYIFMLMSQEFFATKFKFQDVDSFDAVVECPSDRPDCLDDKFCPDGTMDCIPRAHFDTPLWAFTTVFQVMTGENWNTIMYAGMRSTNFHAAFYFVLLILFGQTLVLSLFLSMLMSKFDEVQDEIEEEDRKKMQKKKVAKVQAQKKMLKKLKTGIGEEGQSSAKRRNAEDDYKAEDVDASAGQPSDDEANEPDSQEDGVVRAHSTNAVQSTSPLDKIKESWKSVTDPIFNREGWPNGYSLFLLHENFFVRVFCEKVLVYEAPLLGSKVKVFDNLVLICILLSTVCMAIDFPLRDPDDPITIVVKQADLAFTWIFIVEMAFKLLARGLVWGPNAYLKSGWNWLDGTVVTVSIIGMSGASSSGGLKTLRILRAFRPLRVISRNENLKVVVQTIFASMPDLFTLVIVAMLFLLIFALFALTFLSGRLQHCADPDGILFLQNVTANWATPLCLRPNTTTHPLWSDLSAVSGDYTACTRGSKGDGDEWEAAQDCSACGQPTEPWISWQRVSADTPICVSQCDPDPGLTRSAPSALCPAALTSVDQVKSACGDVGTAAYTDKVRLEFGAADGQALLDAEAIGATYVEKYQRQLVMPCSGWTVQENSGGELEEVKPDGVVGCRELMCPNVDPERTQACKDTCEAARDDAPGQWCTKDGACKDENSATCKACRKECQAQCECKEFCGAGLTMDAALCVEQGGEWSEVLSQNFNNIGRAMITLFEISTTEGWVDVMYAAADSYSEFHMQPTRDRQEILWALYFMLYIFLSFMFIINLSVGVIVDKFMDLKTEVQTTLVEDVGQPYDTLRVASQSGLMPDMDIAISGEDMETQTRKIKSMPKPREIVLDKPLDQQEGACFVRGSCITKQAEQVMSTESQDQWKKHWLEARQTLDGRKMIYNLTNLHELPPCRRSVYDFVCSRFFENGIMACICINTLVMCLKVFPAPEDWWEDFLTSCNYAFAAIFTVEAVLKLIALRLDYFKDSWNVFDFTCVIATIAGIVISQMGSGANFAAVTSVIRIFRIARLFRLLRFLKGLNKIFMALLLSLPKLANVFMILLLMLVLYSILGVNLFSTMKQGETFNYHGNFNNFLWAFVTLFRASTGEAWNEVMHDLMKSERDVYRSGEWCTPASLFDPENADTYKKLASKCLIENPNSCSNGPGVVLAPVFFWVSYTLVITFIIMNLVIAVILEGYEDGKPTREGQTIDRCIREWRYFDPDQRMELPLNDAMAFIAKVTNLPGVLPKPEEGAKKSLAQMAQRPSLANLKQAFNASTVGQGQGTTMKDFANIPMRVARQLDMHPDNRGMITFKQAAQQAVRLACFSDPDKAKEIDRLEDARKKTAPQGGFDVREDIAARKLQGRFRERREIRSSSAGATERSSAWQAGVSSGVPDRAVILPHEVNSPLQDSAQATAGGLSKVTHPKDGDEDQELRQASQGIATDPPSEVQQLTPPRAG